MGPWHERWIGHPGTERFYRYIRADGAFVGEAAYRWDAEAHMYLADVIIHASCRGRGYGSRALDMLCQAARQNGVQVLYDQLAIDNPARSLFLRCGFEEVSRSEDAVLLKKYLTL